MLKCIGQKIKHDHLTTSAQLLSTSRADVTSRTVKHLANAEEKALMSCSKWHSDTFSAPFYSLWPLRYFCDGQEDNTQSNKFIICNNGIKIMTETQ